MKRKEDWKRDMARKIKTFVVYGLLIAGTILLSVHGKNFVIAVKPSYTVDYLMENGVRKGMHVRGEINFIYDCFAEMENMKDDEVTAYYYALPAGDGMMALYVPVEMQDVVETLLDETVAYLETGTPPSSVIPVEGQVVKAEGRLPYLLSEYMKDIGYSQEEIEAMGETLMLQDASGSLRAARIYAPVGMIMLALGILAIVFGVLWERIRREGKKCHTW